jgi:hypothetical protein
MIDDVRLIEKPANELAITNYMLGTEDPQNFAVSYGMVPVEQEPSMSSLTQVYNQGVNNQTNVATRLHALQGSATYSDISAATPLAADSTVEKGNYVDLSGFISGTYYFALGIASDSANAVDPEGIRQEYDTVATANRLTITEEVYAVDNGYPTAEVGSEYADGTAQDGARFANALFVKNPDTLTAVRVYLGPSAVPQGDLLIKVSDTTPTFGTAFNAGMGGDWPNVVLKSDPYKITQADTAQGYAEIPIPEILSGGTQQNRILQPDLYYVSVSMFSNAGANPIYILDDRESRQGDFASIYYHYPNARWFTDGNALWIRAIFGRNPCTNVTNNISAEICTGESYEVGGQSFTSEGMHTAIVSLPNGCDSVINLDLTVYPTFAVDLIESICEGDSFLFANEYYNTSGFYTFDTVTMLGCDSLLSLDLSVVSIDTQTSVVNDTMYVSAAADSVQWVDCNTGNVVTSSQVDNYFVPSETGMYKAIIYSDGCQEETSCRQVTVVGIEYP